MHAREAQPFQQIGQESPDLAAVAAQHQGWQGQESRPQVEEMSGDFDFSFRDRRANLQALGLGSPGIPGIPSMVAYQETPMAGIPLPDAWDPNRR